MTVSHNSSFCLSYLCLCNYLLTCDLNIAHVQVVHKIQSGSGPLDMQLVQVPKMLSVLRKDWAPNAFCISFKVLFFYFLPLFLLGPNEFKLEA